VEAQPSALDELVAYRSTDPIIKESLQQALDALSAFDAAQALDQLQVCVINPAVASAGLMASQYFTPAAQALVQEKLIVVNEQFLLEIETSIRSFAQASTLFGAPFLKNDAQMFGLVRRIAADPGRSLTRLRRQAQRDTADARAERQLIRQLAMVALFFISHEVGHFLHGHRSGQFATFVDPKEPFESRVEDAVVKLCRHIDEFTPTQFLLPGFEEVTKPDGRVRQVEQQLRARDQRRYERQELFFTNEAEADQWANQAVVAHLGALAQTDAAAADEALFVLASGLFVAALYTWYKDLDLFSRKSGIDQIADLRQLDLTMMQGRERYINAAELFGEQHRFTLLRAALALESIMRARTDWFERPRETRSIWSDHPAEALANDPALQREHWIAESLQRYFLLCACMDTAIKLATIGCATGWILEADRQRKSEQLLVMQFMGIDHAVARVRQLG
jgi:hypothetical protein